MPSIFGPAAETRRRQPPRRAAADKHPKGLAPQFWDISVTAIAYKCMSQLDWNLKKEINPLLAGVRLALP